jgi:peptide deformylase
VETPVIRRNIMIKEILEYPDKRLTVVSEELDLSNEKSIHVKPRSGLTVIDVKGQLKFELYTDLLDTLLSRGGLGLAAPQIGVAKRAILYRNYAKELVVLVNPRITSFKGTTTSMDEGCLSIPGFRGDVKRAKVIKVEAYNEYGSKVKIKANGMEAIILQHEIDHLDGILFIDKVKDSPAKVSYTEKL